MCVPQWRKGVRENNRHAHTYEKEELVLPVFNYNRITTDPAVFCQPGQELAHTEHTKNNKEKVIIVKTLSISQLGKSIYS